MGLLTFRACHFRRGFGDLSFRVVGAAEVSG